MSKVPLTLCSIFSVFSSMIAWEKEYDLKDLWLEKDPAKRIILQDHMQQWSDRTLKAEFDKFNADPNIKTKNKLLRFYDQSFDRLLQQIPKEKPAPGTVVIWYLYNMGFIIKTPTVCFGVDIHHRNAVKLEPLLDFLVTTHNHMDHYSMPLMRAMNAADKPVVSNFFPNAYYTKAAEKTHEIKGITIHCGEADHNQKLRKFTMPMEIICPTGNRKFVFFTSGDTGNHSFLKIKSEAADLYCVHPRNCMSAIDAAKQVNAKLTFIVHLHELSHEYNKWRWKFQDGRDELKIFQENNRAAYVPVWGEKFIWDGKKIHGVQY